MNVIEIENLIYDYPDTRALQNISLKIKEGTITALVGPNGAGKTTLMRCIAALTVPLSGTVKVNGYDICENPREVHANIGYLSDFFGLYDLLTVEESLLFAAYTRGLKDAEADARVKWALEQFNLVDLKERKTTELSRGQKQRVAIGMSCLHKPKILILDEPASGLDPEARMHLAEILVGLKNEGISILVSSHILAELQDYSTDMLVIQKGKIIEHKPLAGTHIAGAKRFKIKLASQVEGVKELLDALPGVDEVYVEFPFAEFSYSGSDTDQANLLKTLILNNIPVSEITENKLNLQEEYLKTLKK